MAELEREMKHGVDLLGGCIYLVIYMYIQFDFQREWQPQSVTKGKIQRDVIFIFRDFFFHDRE